jgi:hypothetical protein
MAHSDAVSFKGITRGIFARAQLVAKDGYTWTDEPPEGWLQPEGDSDLSQGPWLRERLPAFMPPEVQVKAPLRRDRVNPGLHRLFASLQPTERDVLSFARKWGQLGRRQGLVLGYGGYAESLPYWQREIETMQRLILLWELVRTGNSEELASYVRWQTNPRQVRIDLALQYRRLHDEGARRRAERVKLTCPADRPSVEQSLSDDLPQGVSELLACGHEEHLYRSDLLGEWNGDLIRPARYYIHQEVNKHLEGRVNPVVTTPDERGSVELWFVPDTLLASLYVLFALELSDQLLPVQICKAKDCQKVFVPASAKQRYCTNTCRIRTDAKRRRGKLQG